MTDAAVRELTWQDIPAVAAVESVTFPHDPWPAPRFWAELAARPRRHYVVLESADATLMGYGGIDLARDGAEVMTVAVAPQHRGRGHGATLLRALLQHASHRGADRVSLEVRADNPAAIGLYRRHGFDVVRTRRRHDRDGGDALVMRASVAPPARGRVTHGAGP